jgi:hypothetical protein
MRAFLLMIGLAQIFLGQSFGFTKVSDAVYRSDGSQSDTQAAVSAIPIGGTVEIPNGTFNWNGTLLIGKAIILKGQNKDGSTVSCKNSGVDTIKATEPPTGNLEISDLDFDFVLKQNTTNFVIRVGSPSPRGAGRVLVHDCNFKSNYAYSIEWGVNGGVIWNCLFPGDNADGLTGISFVGHSNDDEWTQPSTQGSLDTDGKHNTYVEDCSFTFAPIAMCNFDDNSRTVIRHCSFQDAALGSHGQETSPKGARQWELYDCTFKSDPENKYNMNAYFGVRGGTGVVTDNDMGLVPWSKNTINLCVYSTRRKGQIPCQTTYPAARQIGQGWKGAGGYNYPSVPEDGTGYFTDPIYVWNNRGEATKTPNFVSPNQYEPDECGNNQLISKYVQKDRDYFLSAKPGYAKYPYPHPMRVAVEGGPTPNPSATPEPPRPTPTISPSPTAIPPQPTPTPTQTFEKWLEEQNDWVRSHPPYPDQR